MKVRAALGATPLTKKAESGLQGRVLKVEAGGWNVLKGAKRWAESGALRSRA